MNTLAAGSAFSSWAAFWVPFANHIWQSTLFVAIMGLLALALKKNSASTRYGLWLAASLKFLIPFSVLVDLGHYLAWFHPAETQPLLLAIGQPFTVAPSTPSLAATSAPLGHLLPAILFVIWILGCLAVLAFWAFCWRRLRAAVRGGALTPVPSRELQILRRVEAESGIARQIDLIVSEFTLEPGILGVFRHILFLPQSISSRLTDAELEAVIAHELCHVRRRDNLTSFLHMLVEAIFWCYPLVWWIGARMVEQREQACDEGVLRLGSDAQVYAESILKVCRYCLESPLVCAAGVTGSNLKHRVEAILRHSATRKLTLRKKLLLAAVGVAAVLGPVGIGSLRARPSQSQSAPEAANRAAGKYVLGDLKIEGDVQDPSGLRERILKAWTDRQFADVSKLRKSVGHIGILGDLQDHGYFTARMVQVKVEPLGTIAGQQHILLTVKLEEGAQYHCGGLKVATRDRLLQIPPPNVVGDQFQLNPGDLFNTTKVRIGLRNLKDWYSARGVTDVALTPAFEVNDAKRLIYVSVGVKQLRPTEKN